MKKEEEELAEILLKGNYITEEEIEKARKSLITTRVSFIDYLQEHKLLNKDLIGQAIAESFKVAYSDLDTNIPAKEQILKIPEDIAKKFRVVLFSEDSKKIVITTDNPTQQGLIAEMQKIFNKEKIVITYSLPEDINLIFVHYEKALETRFSKIIEGKTKIAPELLETIFTDALLLNVSDIHFEPTPSDVLVRFRVDGVLRDAGRLPKDHYENILNRIKVQSGIRLDEHFAAQDGAMQFKNNEIFTDLRTSIVPTVEGEKVVLRVLSSYIQSLTLGELGLSEGHQKMFEEIANKPFGMIIVAGPTGSGKTTTLYALLKILNQSDVNITTIEDPVEYKIKGINQIQVNEQTGLTFVRGLRSIVRQDPDTILVGEIRDQETAEIAVNAALTGHLLLSSFHANDAATAIPRLLDMGVESFLLASTLELVVAQRLARRICTHCRFSVTESVSTIEEKYPNLKDFFEGNKITLYKGKGCEVCNNSGYKGRVAIFEFIPVSFELQNLILKNPSTQEIWKLARKQGAHSIFEDGLDKVKSGVTTLEELMRVAESPVIV